MPQIYIEKFRISDHDELEEIKKIWEAFKCLLVDPSMNIVSISKVEKHGRNYLNSQEISAISEGQLG